MPSVQRTYRLGAVCKKTTLHRSTIHKRVKKGTFPKPMMEGRNPMWHEADIVAYQNDVRAKAGLPDLEEFERPADESPRPAQPPPAPAGERSRPIPQTGRTAAALKRRAARSDPRRSPSERPDPPTDQSEKEENSMPKSLSAAPRAGTSRPHGREDSRPALPAQLREHHSDITLLPEFMRLATLLVDAAVAAQPRGGHHSAAPPRTFRRCVMNGREKLIAEVIFDDLADADAAEIALCEAGYVVEQRPDWDDCGGDCALGRRLLRSPTTCTPLPRASRRSSSRMTG